jgi:hypothetical protein
MMDDIAVSSIGMMVVDGPRDPICERQAFSAYSWDIDNCAEAGQVVYKAVLFEA